MLARIDFDTCLPRFTDPGFPVVLSELLRLAQLGIFCILLVFFAYKSLLNGHLQKYHAWKCISKDILNFVKIVQNCHHCNPHYQL